MLGELWEIGNSEEKSMDLLSMAASVD
ncbi:hypothetical protein Tco_0018049, partial [Tanacetum coccineum]